MSRFVIFATLLTLGAVTLLVIPLTWRRTAGRPAVGAALICAIVLAGGSAGLYAVWSNWPWAAPSTEFTPEAMVGRLARRLEKNPNDLEGWLRLGRSYAVLEQYPLSIRAYQNANRLANGQNAEALIGLGEALISRDGRMPEGGAGQLFERALRIAPDHPKALWYAGLTAYQAGRLDVARKHWAALVALNPPPKVKQLLEEKVADLDRQLRQVPPQK